MEQNAEMQQAVKVYKALGEPSRLKIAFVLRAEGEQCCSELGDKLNMLATSTLSHHLKQMAESGLLKSRKEGTFIYYSLDVGTAQKYAPYLLN
ncbi:metalloregulator ArsR/SmtB family transcription factor [Paenibacillus filicis]|uniref:Metalloregulator ArsR/SmtB family transcription factor n=1 Tax=Paenibacillus filicis TaxID=669464 RepID=A0ABU9DRS3_9BACL